MSRNADEERGPTGRCRLRTLEPPPRLRRGSATWRYLTPASSDRRCVEHAAARMLFVRAITAAPGSPIATGRVCHVEIRGLTTRARSPADKRPCSAARRPERDAGLLSPKGQSTHSASPLSKAAAPHALRRDRRRDGSRYLGALQAILAGLAANPDALVVSAADANAAGDRYAECHAELADAAGYASSGGARRKASI